MADGRVRNGGKRPGAGRKPGSKDRYNREEIEKARAEGIMPLDYLLEVVRDKKAKKRDRMDAAKAAAPYCHKRMPQDIDATVNGNFLFEVMKYADATKGKVPNSE